MAGGRYVNSGASLRRLDWKADALLEGEPPTVIARSARTGEPGAGLPPALLDTSTELRLPGGTYAARRAEPPLLVLLIDTLCVSLTGCIRSADDALEVGIAEAPP